VLNDDEAAKGEADPGGPDAGGPDFGGPDPGGPDAGGPDFGGPDPGGPDPGGPEAPGAAVFLLRGIVFEDRFFSLKNGCEVWDQAELPSCNGDDEVGSNSRASRLGLMRV